MKKISCFLLFAIFLLPQFICAQVGIGTIDLLPSALMELNSNSQGLLIPRMTSIERDLIANPANGLLIYNTNTSNLSFFDKNWIDFSSFVKNYNFNSSTPVLTSPTNTTVVEGTSTTLSFSGKYKITFNSSFRNAPVIRESYSTGQLNLSLIALYARLKAIPTTVLNHGQVFGSGETLYPGVYELTGAVSTSGVINFDGNGSENSLFVIKLAAAFTSGAGTTMVLKNGAKASNIFWLVENASALVAGTVLKGTLITNNGANTMAAGGNVEGRLFSIIGAVGFSTGTAIVPTGNSSIDLGDLSYFVFFSGNGAVSNAATSNITGDIGTNAGTITGLTLPTVFKGYILNEGLSTNRIEFPNIKTAIGTFGIYQNNELIRFSEKKITSSANYNDVSLQAITTILPNQTIDVRWKTDSETLRMENKNLTWIKLE